MSFTPSIYQEAIFDWFRNPTGPVSINAVAGGAKTTTLVHGFQYAPNGRKLFAAFNASIVKELTKRLPESVTCKTLHALGLSTLASHFSGVKFDLDRGNVKYREMARNINIGEYARLHEPRVVQDCLLSLLNYAQSTLTPLEVEPLVEMAGRFGVEIPQGIPVELFAETVRGMLEKGKEMVESGLISFSDMIYMPAAMGLRPPQFDFIAVDEAQDLNKAQMALLTSALTPNGNFIAVGDPRQAIYMFAGAEPDSFDQLTNHFAAEVMPLSFCYRCPASVIAEAQKIVPHIQCPPGTPEGIVATITNDQFQDMLQRGDMVVCRLTAPLIRLCFELIKRRIPAKVKGRDIGQQIGNVARQVMKRKGSNMAEFPVKLIEWEEAQLDLLSRKLGTEDAQQSVKDKADCLEICYAMFQPHSLESFCRDISELFSDDQSPISLSTVHRAKGLENDRVFIIRPDKLPLTRKGMTPAQRQQEDNLKYVAVTRAKKELYFVEPDPQETNGLIRNPGIPGVTL